VGKLVLFLADGTTLDVPLDRERITIGRRADNDVCLPYPAVSGEHAQVVTILADSFLEDLGSTNGTLVNGKPVTKHFLTDHDMVDIGRQRFTYLSDSAAQPSMLASEAARAHLQGLLDKVQTVKPTAPGVVVRNAMAPAPGAEFAAARAALPAALPRAPAAPAPDAERAGSPPRVEAPGSGTSPLPPASALRLSDSAEPPTPSVRVLSGVNVGRRVPFTRPELTIGRVGVQVAVVRRGDDGFRLVPLEGPEPPRINGAPVAPEGGVLHPGDTFEVAGVRLELSAGA
jgi:hypothetical protein